MKQIFICIVLLVACAFTACGGDEIISYTNEQYKNNDTKGIEMSVESATSYDCKIKINKPKGMAASCGKDGGRVYRKTSKGLVSLAEAWPEATVEYILSTEDELKVNWRDILGELDKGEYVLAKDVYIRQKGSDERETVILFAEFKIE